MKRVTGFLAALLIVSGLALPAQAHNAVGLPLPPGPPPAPPQIEGHKVDLGRMGHGSATVFFNQSIPGTVYVTEGETVTWVNESGAPHSVTFLGDRDPKTLTEQELFAPTVASGAAYEGGFLNSGVLEPTQYFSLSFPKAGVFEYICVIHPGMTGTVVVLPEGARIPTAEQQMAAAELTHAHHSNYADAMTVAASGKAPRAKNADGTTTWNVTLGAQMGGVDLMAFFPGRLTIREGDAVLFKAGSTAEPHSASVFRPEEIIALGNGPMGLNPQILAPAGDGVVDGADQFDGTGLMVAGAPDGKLTFTKAGTYHIHCDLHDGFGMTMVIEVLPRNSTEVYVNGTRLEAGAQIKDGVVYASVRAIADAIGAALTYNAATGTALVTTATASHDHGSTHCKSGDCGSGKALVNGYALDAGYTAYTSGGRMYAPAAAWAAVLGGTAEYDAEADVLYLELPTK